MPPPHALKTCPLCGGPAKLSSHSGSEVGGYSYVVTARCEKCGANVSVRNHSDKNGWNNESTAAVEKRAAKAWNKRALTQPETPTMAEPNICPWCGEGIRLGEPTGVSDGERMHLSCAAEEMDNIGFDRDMED